MPSEPIAVEGETTGIVPVAIAPIGRVASGPNGPIAPDVIDLSARAVGRAPTALDPHLSPVPSVRSDRLDRRARSVSRQ